MKYFVTIAGREFEVEIDGERVTVDGKTADGSLTPVAGTPLRHLTLGDRAVELALAARARGEWTVLDRGERWDVEVIDERTRHIRSLTAGADRAAGAAPLKAPMPGLVVRVLVEPGQAVAAGAGAVVLEAMKMENELKVAAAGTVKAVRVAAGQAVEKGEILVDME